MGGKEKTIREIMATNIVPCQVNCLSSVQMPVTIVILMINNTMWSFCLTSNINLVWFFNTIFIILNGSALMKNEMINCMVFSTHL